MIARCTSLVRRACPFQPLPARKVLGPRDRQRNLLQPLLYQQYQLYASVAATPARHDEEKQPQTRPWPRKGGDEPLDQRGPSMTKGKLLTTPSRLLKLVMPLTTVDGRHEPAAPFALLVHPQQPLSYLERLVQAELPTITTDNGDTRAPSLTFRAVEAGNDDNSSSSSNQDFEDRGQKQLVKWAASTEIGDFIRDAARAREFEIEVEGAPGRVITVAVPSFSDRTRYLRQRLRRISRQIAEMAKLKRECDQAAHKTARRLAVAGGGVLMAYWYLVYRLTFETDLGWDAVEPVTYLVGLSTLISGYLWFLWHNHEVSYRQAMQITISRRQSRMYELKGFDLHKWEALLEAANAARKEIKAVAAEYEVEWDERADEGDAAVTKALRDNRKSDTASRKQPGDDDEEDDKEDEKGGKN